MFIFSSYFAINSFSYSAGSCSSLLWSMSFSSSSSESNESSSSWECCSLFICSSLKELEVALFTVSRSASVNSRLKFFMQFFLSSGPRPLLKKGSVKEVGCDVNAPFAVQGAT